VRYANQGREWRATLFRQRIKSYISTEPQAINVNYAQINGWSMAYQAPFDGCNAALSFEHVNPIQKNAQTANQWLPRRAKNSVKLTLDKKMDNIELAMNVQAFSHRFDDAANLQRVGGYLLVDWKAQWRFNPDWVLAFNLNNVTNKKYETVAGYNQPGRSAYLSLQYATH
jgi:vitamin B12 transporter